MSTTILHITPHMGGGVGRVLQAITPGQSERYRHEIVCLDYANSAALEWSATSGVPVRGEMFGQPDRLAACIRGAGIVHLHWWNHPLIYWFLASAAWPPFRGVIWAHVNGHSAPHIIPRQLLEYADRFVLATPYTESAAVIADQTPQWKQSRLRTVFASAGYDHVADARPQPHEHFHVGYIGTVDYAKMHEDFLSMHAAVKVPAARFIVCGGSREEALRRQACEMGVVNRFDIRGHISNVAEVLSTLDVFGYPLQPRHYGASEVAIIEAMAAGVVPVVLRNGCESYLVSDGENGLIADGTEAYTQAIEYLHRHPALRLRMAWQARRMARERFRASCTVDAWRTVYDEVAELPKRQRRLAINTDSAAPTGYDLFRFGLVDAGERELMEAAVQRRGSAELSCLAELAPVFRGASNGSVYQYQRFFPADLQLRRLVQLMDHENLAGGVTGARPARRDDQLAMETNSLERRTRGAVVWKA